MIKQMRGVVKSSFFQQGVIAKMKPYLSFKDLEKSFSHLYHLLILDECNALHVTLNSSLQNLQPDQSTATHLFNWHKKDCSYQFALGIPLLSPGPKSELILKICC